MDPAPVTGTPRGPLKRWRLTRYSQTVATRGRLSSANPNCQNIPIRTEQGQQIRNAFLAPEGKALLVADHSQVELHRASGPTILPVLETQLTCSSTELAAGRTLGGKREAS